MNLVTITIGFAVSAAFIGFVCTRLFCERCRRIEAEHMSEIESGTNHELPEHRINGLEPVLVAAIPTVKFNHEAFVSIKDPLCMICLGEYQEKELLRIMPRCGHGFHLSCIDEWLGQHSTCPVCRLSVHEDTVGRKDVGAAALPTPRVSSSPGMTVACAEGNGCNRMHLSSVSIEPDSNLSRASTSR